MTDRKQLEARLLSAAELEDVNATRPPAIEQASDEQLKVLAQRLRRARDRAKDIAAGQKREMRGKANPRGTKPTREDGETREGYLQRFRRVNRAAWTTLTDENGSWRMLYMSGMSVVVLGPGQPRGCW